MTERLRRPRATDTLAVAALAGLVAAAGCAPSPLAADGEADLRRSVIHAIRRQLGDAQRLPAPRTTEREFRVEDLGIAPELMPQIETLAGPGAYDRTEFDMGTDLLGQDQRTVGVALDRAIRSAASHNLELQFQRLGPAIAEAQVIVAEAAFDWSLFGQMTGANTDEPRVNTSGFGADPADQRQSVQFQTGLRRNTVTGGQFTIQNELDHVAIEPPLGSGSINNEPDPENSVKVTLQYSQPLLRGFGSDVTLAQTRLNINAERDQVAQLKSRLITTVTETEIAYWRVVQAHWDLLILQHLLDRGIATRDKVVARKPVDATDAQIAQANAQVEQRRAFVINARHTLRRSSDELKLRMNDPDLPVGDESLIAPIDDALDAPFSFSVLDSYLTAVTHRPEMQQAVLAIDDASIRQVVADNNRLPQLDLRLQAVFAGLDDNFGGSYREVADGQFVGYVAALVFEYPLGNREAEGAARRARLERMQTVIAYMNSVDTVIDNVKGSLRDIERSYQLIAQRRVQRVAAAWSLRSFEIEMELRLGFTVQNLEIWFNRQTEVAQAERDEIGALVDYNIALARLYAAMGTTTERNKIEFTVPDAPYGTP
ncbi:MAG: TolC family protein [Phycisphaerales bacterium]